MLSPLKLALKFLALLFLSVALTSCAMLQAKGTGRVIAEQKISLENYKKYNATAAGAAEGAKQGAIGGALGGGLIGAGIANLTGASNASALILPAILGAGVGALYSGVVFGLIGAGIGLGWDLHKHGAALYRITVKPDDHSKPLTVVQYTNAPFALNERVKILEGEEGIVLKKIVLVTRHY